MKKNIKILALLIVGIILIVLVIKSIYSDKSTNQPKVVEQIVSDSISKNKVKLKYGFPIDDFEVIKGKVKRRQNLSEILSKYNVSYRTIDKIARKAKNVFSVRKIRSGKEYAILLAKDSVKTPEYFIYENTAVEYIVFDLRDTLSVYKGEKEVTYEQKQVSGTIESSLWNAMVDANADPLLSISLSEVYAWTIDFFGIAKGDKFNVIYKKAYVEGKPINNIEILAANFTHHKADNYAFAFTQGEKHGFFDEKGNSLQKAFLKAPLRYSRISSRFSNRRFHPVLKRYRAHHGVDYAAPTGTPVHSIGDGVIIKKGYQRRGGGRYLKVRHNSVYTTVYMHFSRFAKGMQRGVRVKQGQTIGYVGSSGLATGPHLDFRVFKNGRAINPLHVKSPPVAPVKKENRPAFDKEVQKYMPLLSGSKSEAAVLEASLN